MELIERTNEWDSENNAWVEVPSDPTVQDNPYRRTERLIHGRWREDAWPIVGTETWVEASSAVDGGGIRILGTLPRGGHYIVASGVQDVIAVIGDDHPAVACYRAATAAAWRARRANGAALAQRTRDGRRGVRLGA